MGLGVAEGSEAAGDCLLDPGHADIALGAGVGEWGVGVAAVRSTSVSYWVSASWRFSASDLAMRPRCPSRRAGSLFPCGLGEDGSIARARGREGCLVEGLGVEFTDPATGSAQEVAQALGPGVAVGVLDERQVVHQAVGMLVQTPFPGMVGSGEVEARTQRLSDRPMPRELLAVVRRTAVPRSNDRIQLPVPDPALLLHHRRTLRDVHPARDMAAPGMTPSAPVRRPATATQAPIQVTACLGR